VKSQSVSLKACIQTRACRILLVVLGVMFLLDANAAGAAEIVILPNGNYLIVDPSYDLPGPILDVGSVSLYRGDNGALVSSLVGRVQGDSVGSGGITFLGTNHFLVVSPLWDNGSALDVGAVTWARGDTGVTGEVSALNSLVGTQGNDSIGSGGITIFGNNYAFLVRSPLWDNGPAASAGAVTWARVDVGVKGEVSALNSLVGTQSADSIGSGGITTFGNNYAYLVRSPLWDNGPAASAGAVTWARVDVGVTGEVSALNSLVGTQRNDSIGSGGITTFGNNYAYLVRSPLWDNGPAASAGAVTWARVDVGVKGEVSALNSLVGTQPNDSIGSGGITTFGNNYAYLVRSPLWDNGPAASAGAVTWARVDRGVTGEVSALNSLVGTQRDDSIGGGGITTFGDNYAFLVLSPLWDNGPVVGAGAVTWARVDRGVTGEVSALNSLVGTQRDDSIGSGGITTFGNNYAFLVLSPLWDNGPVVSAGAITWARADRGVTGEVSALNSLVGTQRDDSIGSGGITTFGNNYAFLVLSPLWDNGPVVGAGAVTWARVDRGVTGEVSAFNSLVGSHTGDVAGSGGITSSSNTYIVSTPNWKCGAGAFTWGRIDLGVRGVISGGNSTVGVSDAAPEIVVFQPQTTNLATGETRTFGSCPVGGTVSLTFRIRNAGTDDLLLTGVPKINVSGADGGLFTVNGPSSALIVTTDSVEFSVQFAPSSGGLKTASLSISNNDADENPFQIQLEGVGASTVSEWRAFYFGSSTDSGDGASLNDYDKDGVVNLVEYAFATNPTLPSNQRFPVPTIIGSDLVISFRGVAGIDYGAEWSNSLLFNDGQPILNSLTPPDYRFSVALDPDRGVFMRLMVSPSQ
jgi:hypothetical protein